MPSLRPAAFVRLRIPLPSDTAIRARQAPLCVFCAYRLPTSPQQRRRQSTSTSTTFNKQPQSQRQTHYTFFPATLPSGPPPHGPFAVDTTALKREFLQLQARAHPDLHPPENKHKAQALSARINEAYKTLQSPLLRAQYLLSLRGVEVESDETAKVEDAELLMEVLETRERIEEAENEDDLLEMKTANDLRIEESVKVLQEAFENDDIEAAKHEAVRLRYWINIKDSLDHWEKGKPVVLEH